MIGSDAPTAAPRFVGSLSSSVGDLMVEVTPPVGANAWLMDVPNAILCATTATEMKFIKDFDFWFKKKRAKIP